LKLLALMTVLLALEGCAHPPQLATSLDIQRSSEALVLVRLKAANLENRVTVPIAVELTGQARWNGQWSKPETLLHPAAFVLNRREQREITKLWRVRADAVRTTLIVKEQETGNLLKSEKTEKTLDGGPPSEAPTSQR
jgi:hypothetical protein